MRFLVFLSLLSSLSLIGCTPKSQNFAIDDLSSDSSRLYSLDGTERKVQFQALLVTSETDLANVNEGSARYEIHGLLRYLFGPLTTRQWAAIQKGEEVEVLMDQARLENGVVVVPYIYRGTWLIGKHLLLAPLVVPVPLSLAAIETPNWQGCTEQEEGHNGWDLYWYFWDPNRYGCDHVQGVNYEEVTMDVSPLETQQTLLSFPEYNKMIRMIDGKPTLSMTFAFGYVEDPATPRPFQDYDAGAREFQRFYRALQMTLSPMGFQEFPILQSHYDNYGTEKIGVQFVGFKDGVEMRVTVVASAGVDQMDLFARSFAQDHEGFFGWFGHSRVGSGFDADQFSYIVSSNPERYSLTSDYLLVYWAGCNSYSYYTQPFFAMKAALNPEVDPHGIKSLDIISNGLPSLFAFNETNAQIVLNAMINFKTPTSYQVLVNAIEAKAQSWGYEVLVNVLGDEDNTAQ